MMDILDAKEKAHQIRILSQIDHHVGSGNMTSDAALKTFKRLQSEPIIKSCLNCLNYEYFSYEMGYICVYQMSTDRTRWHECWGGTGVVHWELNKTKEKKLQENLKRIK